MSDLLKFFEDQLQIAALTFLGVVYIIRLFWLFRFKSVKERTYAAGNPGRGVAVSMMNIALPWAMESIRKRPGFYIQFVIFHLGVTAAISTSFIIPYAPAFFERKAAVLVFQGIIAAALLVGVMRLYRRVSKPYLRLISSADDYFSLILMILFFLFGFLAVPNRPEAGEWLLLVFFGLTALLLFYVPFSKICHYLYYPFTRFYLGRTLGHRGVVSKKRRTGKPEMTRPSGSEEVPHG
jgi:nitrate reductase gamma subunit